MKAITTKFHGPTNTRGSRISATDNDGNRVMVSSDHSLSSDGKHDKAAIALCRKMSWSGCLMRGGIKGGNVYVFIDDSSVVRIPVVSDEVMADYRRKFGVSTVKASEVVSNA